MLQCVYFVEMLAEIYLIQKTCFKRSEKKAIGIKKRATSFAYDMYVCISKVGISLQQCARNILKVTHPQWVQMLFEVYIKVIYPKYTKFLSLRNALIRNDPLILDLLETNYFFKN